MKSKTTWIGILMIAGAVCTAAAQLLQGHPVDYAIVGATLMAGIGFIHTQDGPKPQP